MITKKRSELIKARIKDLKWGLEYHKNKIEDITLDLEVWQKQLKRR